MDIPDDIETAGGYEPTEAELAATNEENEIND